MPDERRPQEPLLRPAHLWTKRSIKDDFDLLDATRQTSEFTHSDTWRVFRIMSETSLRVDETDVNGHFTFLSQGVHL